MPENDFEKQVQQKMDELRFAPSAGVWEEVEKQITETKKRRSLLVWLLLFLLLSSAGWFYTQNGKKKANTNEPVTQESVAKNKNNNNELSPVKDNPANASKPGTSGIQPSQSQDLPKKDGAVESNTVANNSTTPEGIVKDKNSKPLTRKSSDAQTEPADMQAKFKNTDKNKIGLALSGSAIATSKTKKNAASKTTQASKTGSNSAASASTEAPVTNYPGAEVPAETVVKATVIASLNKGNIQANPVEGDIALLAKKERETDSVASAAEKNTTAKKNNKMMWGVSVGAGVANLSKGFSVFTASPVRDANNFSFSAPSNATGGSNQPGSVSVSDVKPGAAFSAGVLIRKPLQKTWSFFAGIQYAYFSTKISVGRKIDSSSTVNQNGLDKSISSYYQPGNNSSYNYTNHYHFIGLSPGIETQLGRKSKFSVNTGLSISRLIGSNALQYDMQKNIYYQDNSIFNKTQAGMFAGFNYQLLQRSSILTVGPQLSYSFTNLYKNETYGNRHLFFITLTARLFFHRK